MQPIRQFGPYQLIRRIGGGGMAEIYLAKTQGVAGFEKFLAIKLLREDYLDDEEFVEMLVNEAKIAVRLHHKNVVQVFDLGQIGKRYFIAMEFVDGRDLQDLLVETAKQDTYVPYEAAAWIVREACAGLHYAHTRLDENGRPLCIVHRDVSPQNVLLSFTGEVKIADFGIAKANIARSETQVGVIKGKFCYMSPEHAWGDKLDNRSDVFSVGVVLYELLTGEMLYQEEDQLRLLDKVRRAQIPPPTMIRRDIPSDLEAITMMALERDRKDRFMSAAALQQELTRYLAKNAPQYGAERLQSYLREVFGVQTTEFEEEVRALDPKQQTRNAHVDSIEEGEFKSLVMERGEYVLDEASSLVHAFQDLVATAGQTRPPASQRGDARKPQDSTRPVRLTAGMNQDGGTTDIDNDPTKAHSREDIRRSLAEHGVEMKTGDATNPDGIAAESTLEEDPTKLYDPESVRRAVTGDSPPIFGDETEPISRDEVQNQVAAHLERQRANAPLQGPEQAEDGSWDPQSEAILLVSSDLLSIEEDPAHMTPNEVADAANRYHHLHAAPRESAYNPQRALLPQYFEREDVDEDAATRLAIKAHDGGDDLDNKRTVPVMHPDAQPRADTGQPESRARISASGARSRRTQFNRTGVSPVRESYSGLWLLAGSLFVLGVVAVLIVLLAG